MPADLVERSGRTLAAAVVLTVLLAGCSAAGDAAGDAAGAEPSRSRSDTPEATTAAAAVSVYAALGDSYTSAPLVPTTDLAEGCFRSDGNYPSLLEDRLEPDQFVDVSCSAADTDDVTGPQATAGGRGRVPAQLRAVPRDADLVTVGIGANDEGLFARLIACVRDNAEAGCSAALASSGEVLRRTRDRVAEVLDAIESRAPKATVVLIGYPRLVAPESPCPLVPAPAERLDELAQVEVALDRSLQAAARSASAEYVDMHEASNGHEVCSPDPWVNGRRTDQERALAYHPFAVGQQAVAERVVELVAEQRGDEGA